MLRVAWFALLLSALRVESCDAEIPQPLLERIKGSVARVKFAQGGATAFCIAKHGLFLTNRHVVQAIGNGPCLLELSNGKWNTVACALGASKIHDLGLIMTANPPPQPGILQVLEFAHGFAVKESTKIIVPGYPTTSGEFPSDHVQGTTVKQSIMISEGEITAIRPWILDETIISFHASSTYGGSGSPILNRDGRVIGVLFGGPLMPLDVGRHGFIHGHTLSSIDRFFRSGPFLSVVANPVRFEDRMSATELKAFAVGVEGPTEANQVLITFRTKSGGVPYAFQRSAPGRFRIRLPLISNRDDPLFFKTEIDFTTGKLSGWMENQPLPATNSPQHFRDFFRVDQIKDGWLGWSVIEKQPYYFRSIQVPAVALKVGNASFRIPMSMVRQMRIDSTPAVPYSAVIKHNGKIIKRTDGAFRFATPPIPVREPSSEAKSEGS